jgi:hypothetical protein
MFSLNKIQLRSWHSLEIGRGSVSQYVWDDGLECRFPHIPTMYRIVVCDVGFHTLTMSAMDAVYCV